MERLINIQGIGWVALNFNDKIVGFYEPYDPLKHGDNIADMLFSKKAIATYGYCNPHSLLNYTTVKFFVKLIGISV